jgi:hypothetical protein
MAGSFTSDIPVHAMLVEGQALKFFVHAYKTFGTSTNSSTTSIGLFEKATHLSEGRLAQKKGQSVIWSVELSKPSC